MVHERYTRPAGLTGRSASAAHGIGAAYGTGSLRVVGGSWLGSWYGPDGRRVQRKVGAVRTEGRADGLTKAQAERALRRMREIESPRPAPDGRAHDDGGGRRRVLRGSS